MPFFFIRPDHRGPGRARRTTVKVSSFLKNGGRGISSPTTPTRTMRPLVRQASAANSMGSLLSVAAVMTTAVNPGASGDTALPIKRRSRGDFIRAHRPRQIELRRFKIRADYAATLALSRQTQIWPIKPSPSDKNRFAEVGLRENGPPRGDGGDRCIGGLLEGDAVRNGRAKIASPRRQFHCEERGQRYGPRA